MEKTINLGRLYDSFYKKEVVYQFKREEKIFNKAYGRKVGYKLYNVYERIRLAAQEDFSLPVLNLSQAWGKIVYHEVEEVKPADYLGEDCFSVGYSIGLKIASCKQVKALRYAVEYEASPKRREAAQERLDYLKAQGLVSDRRTGHFYEEGQRVKLRLVNLTLDRRSSQYGPLNLATFEDDLGRLFFFKGKKSPLPAYHTGIITAKIKHSTWKGKQKTYLTYCKTIESNYNARKVTSI